MIYFLEDDDSIRKLVIYGLESQGFEAEGFSLPSAFWRAMEQKAAELVLLVLPLTSRLLGAVMAAACHTTSPL